MTLVDTPTVTGLNHNQYTTATYNAAGHATMQYDRQEDVMEQGNHALS